MQTKQTMTIKTECSLQCRSYMHHNSKSNDDIRMRTRRTCLKWMDKRTAKQIQWQVFKLNISNKSVYIRLWFERGAAPLTNENHKNVDQFKFAAAWIVCLWFHLWRLLVALHRLVSPLLIQHNQSLSAYIWCLYMHSLKSDGMPCRKQDETNEQKKSFIWNDSKEMNAQKWWWWFLP